MCFGSPECPRLHFKNTCFPVYCACRNITLIKNSLAKYGIKKGISFPSLYAMKMGEQLKTYNRTFKSSNFLIAHRILKERINQDEANGGLSGKFPTAYIEEATKALVEW